MMKKNVATSALILISSLLASVTYARYPYSLVLSKEQAILLPAFDISAIKDQHIINIGLSLYLEKMNPKMREVRLMLSAYDPLTKEISEELPILLKPSINEYNKIKLPTSFFVPYLIQNKQLIVRTIDDVELFFVNTDVLDRDPMLSVTTQEGYPTPTEPAVQNLVLLQINIGDFVFGDKINGTKNVAKNLNIKFSLLGIGVGGLINVILVRMFYRKKHAISSTSQIHNRSPKPNT